MNKKFIWVLGILCAVFSTQSFARETSSFDQTKKRYEAVSGERAEKIFMEMLYKDFFFHRAAEVCSMELANFFLDKITKSDQIDKYLMQVRKPYGDITVDPYQQAVVSNCLPVVEAIDIKMMQLMSMKLKARIDPYASCNSNLHLMILSKSQAETKSEMNRDMVKYFLMDSSTPFLKNMDDCKPVDVLDLNRAQIENYHVIRHELSSRAIGAKSHLEEWADEALESCRVGYNTFVAPKTILKTSK
ncbi:MAG: hypothetical protein IT286_02440 [Proteobacteria bacterium]|jgi:hypothetical protein|nr:hypothetical protein [Pseudomonadota bacterium]